MNSIQSIKYYLPDQSTLVNKAKDFSKVAAIGIAVITASTLAYYSPFLYVSSLILSSVSLAYYSSNTIMTGNTAEKMKLITAVAIGIIGIGAAGACIGIGVNGAIFAYESLKTIKTFLPFISYFPPELYTSLIGVNFSEALLGTSIATGSLGMLTYAKGLIDTANELYNKPTTPDLRYWAYNFTIQDRNRLIDSFFLKLHLFMCIATNRRSSNDYVNRILDSFNEVENNNFQQQAPQNDIDPLESTMNKIQGSLAQLNFVFGRNNDHQKNVCFASEWPIITNSLQEIPHSKRNEVIITILEQAIHWEIPREENRKQVEQFFYQYLDAIDTYIFVDKKDLVRFRKEFQAFKSKIQSIDTKKAIDPIKLDELKDQINEFRSQFAACGKKLALSKQICEWNEQGDTAQIQANIKEINGYLTDLNSQTKKNSTIFDKVQLLSSKVAAKQNNLDKTDSLWNFLASNGTTLPQLQQMTKAQSIDDIDAFFIKKGIGTVGDLINKGITTEEELLEINVVTKEKLKEIEKKIIGFLNPSVPSIIYSNLAPINKNSSYSGVIAKVDRVCAVIFYRMTMYLSVLAPLITAPHVIVPGIAIGTSYSIINAISGGRLNNYFANIFRRERNIGIEYWKLFGRRTLLMNDVTSAQDVQTFIHADTFGRLRMLSFETGVSFLTSFTETGSIVQSIMIGKEISETIGSVFKRQVLRLL